MSKSFTKQSLFTGLNHVATMMGGFVLHIIISRIFGPEGRGVFGSAFALANITSLLLGTGHESANTYFIASGKQKVSEAAGSSLIGLTLSMIALSVATVLIVYLRPAFVVLLSNKIILLALCTVPLHWICIYLFGLVRGLGRADLAYARFSTSVFGWLISVVCLCVILKFRQLEIVFIARLMGMSFSLFVALWFVKKISGPLKFSFSWKNFKDSITYGIKENISRIANPMMVRFDMLVLPVLLIAGGPLGLYAQGIAILDRILVLPTVVGYVLMAKAAKESQKSVDVTATLCRLSFIITLVLGLSVMLSAKFLVPFLFGAKFAPAVLLMWIVFPGVMLRSIPRVLQNYFLGTGHPGKVCLMFTAGLVAMLTTDFVLITQFGFDIKGAAIGALIGCLVEFSLFTFMFKRSTGLGITNICFIKLSDLVLIKDLVRKQMMRKKANRLV